MEETPEEYYTAMAALCGADFMRRFEGSIVIVHWPYNSDDTGEKMRNLYGWGYNAEAAAKMFLERNGLLP